MNDPKTWGELENKEEFSIVKLKSIPRGKHQQFAKELLQVCDEDGFATAYALVEGMSEQPNSDGTYGTLPKHMKDFYLSALKPLKHAKYPDDTPLAEITDAMHVGYYGYNLGRVDGYWAFEGIVIEKHGIYNQWYETLHFELKKRYLKEKFGIVIAENESTTQQLTYIKDRGWIHIDTYLNVTSSVHVSEAEVMAVFEANLMVTWEPIFDKVFYDWARGALISQTVQVPGARTIYELGQLLRLKGAVDIAKRGIILEGKHAININRVDMVNVDVQMVKGVPVKTWQVVARSISSQKDTTITERELVLVHFFGSKLNAVV